MKEQYDKYILQKIRKLRKDGIIHTCIECQSEFILDDIKIENITVCTKPCELCGEHGSIKLKNFCMFCEHEEIITLEEW